MAQVVIIKEEDQARIKTRRPTEKTDTVMQEHSQSDKNKSPCFDKVIVIFKCCVSHAVFLFFTQVLVLIVLVSSMQVIFLL